MHKTNTRNGVAFGSLLLELNRVSMFKLLTHEDLAFELLEALVSWTRPWVVAAEEDSMFEWMSSVITKQITILFLGGGEREQKAPCIATRIIHVQCSRHLTNNDTLLMNKNSKVLEYFICLSNLLFNVLNTLFPFINHSLIEGNFIIQQNYLLPARFCSRKLIANKNSLKLSMSWKRLY